MDAKVVVRPPANVLVPVPDTAKLVAVAFAIQVLPESVVEERVALVPKTRAPEPVSSVTRVASSLEVSISVCMMNVEVEVSTHALPVQYRMSPAATPVVSASPSSVMVRDSASRLQVVPLQVNSPKSVARRPVGPRSNDEVAMSVQVEPFQ